MYNLLFVDDEPVIKMAFRDLLGRMETDYTLVGTVSNGQEALAFVRRRPVDIVVTDLKMPVMDGLALIRHLQAERFPGAILVLSNYSDFALVREALLSGASDYMLKVNMNAEALSLQLSQIAQKLAQKHELREHAREAMPLVTTEKYRQAVLRAFLQENQTEESLLDAQQADCVPLVPFVLMDVLLAPQPVTKSSAEESMRRVLLSLLGDSGNVRIVHMPNDEYLCIVPAFSDSSRIQNKAIQLIRQLHMYLNRSCCVLTTEAVEGISGLQNKYRQCRKVQRLLFYMPYSSHFAVEETGLTALSTSLRPEKSAQLLMDHYFAKGLGSLQEDVDRFLTQCENKRVDPQELLEYAYRVTQVLLYLTPHAEQTLAFSRQAELLRCQNSKEMRSLLLCFLPQLLDKAELLRRCHKDIRAVLIHLQYHYSENQSLEEIADTVGLSRSYLCRLFKKEIGKSLFEYLNDLRMQKAAELIAGGNAYIREISTAVGIEDPYYFTRIFRRHFQMSPSQYRELHDQTTTSSATKLSSL